MRIILPALALLLLGQTAQSQTLSDYLKLRAKLGITQSVGVEALETLVGARVVEVKGTVKGSMKVGDIVSLMLQKSDGGTLVVEGTEVPNWLEGNEVAARLLVRAERSHETAEVRARLIGAATERDISAAEARMRPAKTASRKKSAPKIEYTPPKGKGLWGPIGKGGNKKTASREWLLPASEATPYYAGFIKKRNPRLSNNEAYRIAQGVIGFSIHYGVDARLIMAMVMTESGFNPKATSRAGAQGLGQLMPGTARGMGVSNSYDSIENLYGTVKLVRGHLATYTAKTGNSFDGLVLMLAAYNAGSGAVRKHGGVPPYRETQNYIRKVIGVYNALKGG
ncbi:MAG: lytic transglycosylase domain-containing protein [Fimbriimonadaceae bacterium]